MDATKIVTHAFDPNHHPLAVIIAKSPASRNGSAKIATRLIMS